MVSGAWEGDRLPFEIGIHSLKVKPVSLAEQFSLATSNSLLRDAEKARDVGLSKDGGLPSAFNREAKGSRVFSCNKLQNVIFSPNTVTFFSILFILLVRTLSLLRFSGSLSLPDFQRANRQLESIQTKAPLIDKSYIDPASSLAFSQNQTLINN